VINLENHRLDLENMNNLIMWNHIINQQENNPTSPFKVSYQIKQTTKFCVGDWILVAWGSQAGQHSSQLMI
jgi:hypothetical protein